MAISAAASTSVALNAMLSSGDISGALMFVQTQRTQLLDKQLASQINDVKTKNESSALLNTAMAKLNVVLAAFPKNADSKDTIADWNSDKINKLEKPLNDALKAAGLLNIGTGSAGDGRLGDGSLVNGTSVFRGDRTYLEVKNLVSEVQGKLDNMNSTTQMDMMGLQSLSNKRNEAFDLMTNFMKKVQDSISSILSNLRG